MMVPTNLVTVDPPLDGHGIWLMRSALSFLVDELEERHEEAFGSVRDGTRARQPTELFDQILPDGAEREGGHQCRTNVYGP
jgi:hypothetical protein